MNKKFFLGITALAVAFVSGYNVYRVNVNSVKLSDLAMANVEALSMNEIIAEGIKMIEEAIHENAKIKLLCKLREKVEVIICVYAGDIERNKIRGDFGITYDMDVLRLIDDLRSYNLDVNSGVIKPTFIPPINE